MNRKIPIFLFFGPPGVGKGTQSKLVVERLGYSCFAMGDALRAEVKDKTELGLQIKDCMASGELVNDELILSVVSGWLKRQAGCKEEITETIGVIDAPSSRGIRSVLCSKAIVLDGFPRTSVQVSGLVEFVGSSEMFFLKAFIELELDRALLTERLRKRRDLDGRDDDSDHTIDKRLDLYYSSIAQVGDDLKEVCEYTHKVHGDGTIEEVYCRLLECMTV